MCLHILDTLTLCSQEENRNEKWVFKLSEAQNICIFFLQNDWKLKEIHSTQCDCQNIENKKSHGIPLCVEIIE